MASQICGTGGPRVLGGQRDSEGYRTYKVIHRVECARTDGPATVMQTPGLPLPGALWSFMDDVDVFAWCRNDMTVQMSSPPGRPCRFYDVEQTFSNKPPSDDRQRCNDTPVEDPLMEPMRVSGSFTRYTEEAVYDRFGRELKTSSHEQIRGPQAEFDANRPTVKIEQNVADLQLDLLSRMMADGGSLNDSPLWGVIIRGVRLAQVSWTKKYYGQCYAYYTRVLDFEINVKRNVGVYGAVTSEPLSLGSGYTEGDLITLAGGTRTSPTVLRVDGVTGGGAITGTTIHTPGRYSTPPTNPISPESGGSGTGATFGVTYALGTTISSGWDRDLLDEGTKVLNGYWHRNGYWAQRHVDELGTVLPDPSNPADFIRFTDRKGNPANVILNGRGVPYDTGALTSGTSDDQPGNIHIEKYPEDNLLLLGIPLVL